MGKGVLLRSKHLDRYRTLLEYCPTDINLELEVLRLARCLKVFTADDLHILDPTLDALDLDRRVYGSILHNLSKQGRIKRVGYVPSERDICHNRPVAKWKLVERKQQR